MKSIDEEQKMKKLRKQITLVKDIFHEAKITEIHLYDDYKVFDLEDGLEWFYKLRGNLIQEILNVKARYTKDQWELLKVFSNGYGHFKEQKIYEGLLKQLRREWKNRPVLFRGKLHEHKTKQEDKTTVK